MSTQAPPSGPLAQRLFERVLEAPFEYVGAVGNGWDPRKGWERTFRERVKDLALSGAARAGLGRRQYHVPTAAAALAEVCRHLHGFERTYALLADEWSRDLLVSLLAYRVLGPRHVALPVTLETFWAEAERIERELGRGPVAGDGAVSAMNVYEVPTSGGRIRVNGRAEQVVEFFVLEQYAYDRGGTRISAEPGDVVIDGGGFTGDTALYFADAVGPAGRVVCLEFVPENLELLRRNLEQNPELAGRIEVVEQPLWRTEGEPLEFDNHFGRSSVLVGEGSQTVTTTSIDHLVESGVVDRVDLIKLDIEGAEPMALEGARRTIERLRPKLAISAYHRDDDLAALPAAITEYGPGYDLYLDHFLPSEEETVIFAQAGRGSNGHG